jgi:hypothetical protein
VRWPGEVVADADGIRCGMTARQTFTATLARPLPDGITEND